MDLVHGGRYVEIDRGLKVMFLPFRLARTNLLYLGLWLIFPAIGAWTVVTSHPIRPVELDGTIATYVEAQSGSRYWNELTLQGNTTTYIVDKNKFHPTLPDKVWEEGQIQIWTDMGSRGVIAMVLYDKQDLNPTKYTTRHYDYPESGRADAIVGAVIISLVGTITVGIFAWWRSRRADARFLMRLATATHMPTRSPAGTLPDSVGPPEPIAPAYREPTAWTRPMQLSASGLLVAHAVFLVTAAVFFVNHDSMVQAFQALGRSPSNIDRLVNVARGASFFIALCELVAAIGSFRGWLWIFQPVLVLVGFGFVVELNNLNGYRQDLKSGIPFNELADGGVLPIGGVLIANILYLLAFAMFVWMLIGWRKFGPWAMRGRHPTFVATVEPSSPPVDPGFPSRRS